MRRTKIFTLALLLVCGGWLHGWGAPLPALAADLSEAPYQSPIGEGAPVGLDILPPLPFTKATMDLPRIRLEREASIAASPRLLLNKSNGFAVTHDGKTALHLDVSRARMAEDKWIEVDLSEQTLYAWVGDDLEVEFVISSGITTYPTVEGVFRMWVRTPTQTMSGGSFASGTYYNLPNVQWVQYFYGEFAFHGTYWHSNFGTPMSHGCVNLTIEDAEWLFNWSYPEWDGSVAWLRSTEENATLVWVHE